MSPRTKQAYGQMREARIDEIVSAACQIFAAKGYSATMIEDITAAAGISKGLLYHYFSSKDALFVAVVQREMEGALALIKGAAAQPGTPWDRLHGLVSEVLARARHDPEAYLLIVQAYLSQAAPEEARALAIEYTTASSQAIRALIVEGQAADEVVMGDPVQMAATFTACLQGLALSAAAPTYPESDWADIEIVLRMLAARPGRQV
jgi:AcrR family transcriptional regulator